jgi:hypothetical protein
MPEDAPDVIIARPLTPGKLCYTLIPLLVLQIFSNGRMAGMGIGVIADVMAGQRADDVVPTSGLHHPEFLTDELPASTCPPGIKDIQKPFQCQIGLWSNVVLHIEPEQHIDFAHILSPTPFRRS